jgi:hypothetical protein
MALSSGRGYQRQRIFRQRSPRLSLRRWSWLGYVLGFGGSRRETEGIITGSIDGAQARKSKS